MWSILWKCSFLQNSWIPFGSSLEHPPNPEFIHAKHFKEDLIHSNYSYIVIAHEVSNYQCSMMCWLWIWILEPDCLGLSSDSFLLVPLKLCSHYGLVGTWVSYSTSLYLDFLLYKMSHIRGLISVSSHYYTRYSCFPSPIRLKTLREDATVYWERALVASNGYILLSI